MSLLEAFCPHLSQVLSDANMKTVKEELTAFVPVEFYFVGESEQDTNTESLIKENGKWKIKC